jgi:beta-carotene/zeaxanthin 4-ketolase
MTKAWEILSNFAQGSDFLRCIRFKFKADMKNIDNLNGVLGLLISLIIINLWLTSLIFLLLTKISNLTFFAIIISIFLRTFFQTGLFITAHDAMHSSVFPNNRKINNLIGSTATTLYAFLAYRTLLEKHRMHHRFPASQDDPDFHDGSNPGVISWYFRFMKGYLDQRQFWITFTGIIFILTLFNHVFDISIINLILFWILPLLFSSFQLFYFGTFLPHRQPAQGFLDRHCASSTSYSIFWSFITCYHFGYHWEHHEYPKTPWYKLPTFRTETRLTLTQYE